MEKPRIALLTRPVDENLSSGSGQHWYEIVKTLLRLNREFSFTLAHYRESDNHIYQDVIGQGGEELILPRNPVSASRVLERRGFDVIHYYLPTFFSPIYGVRARKVVTIHGAEPVLLPRYYREMHVLHDRYVVPAVIRAMDHIACVSKTTEAYARKHYPLRHTQRLSTIYNGVDPLFRPLGPGPHQANREHKTGTHYFFHLSKYSLRKNPWTILGAFARFVQRRGAAGDPREWRLAIGGSGWDNFRVRGFLKRTGMEDRIRLLGFVEREELPELYSGAHAFIFPSLCEGFGMPNVEAMACGCPVITSDSFAIPEIVGDAARIISPAQNAASLVEEMNRLVTEPEERILMVRRSVEVASRYRWEESAEKLLRVYRELSEQHRRQRRVRVGPWIRDLPTRQPRAVGE
ncbi:MAG: glycosyltransferase family 4 protein [Spirochaetaceae bacterium]